MDPFAAINLRERVAFDASQMTALRATLAESTPFDVWRWSDEEVLEAIAARQRPPLLPALPSLSTAL